MSIDSSADLLIDRWRYAWNLTGVRSWMNCSGERFVLFILCSARSCDFYIINI